MDFTLVLVLLPIFALAITILFASRADPFTTRTMNEAQENPAIKFKVITSTLIAPIIVLYLNDILGVVFLTVSGLMMLFQEQLFAGHSLLSNSMAKLFGYMYLVVAALWSIIT